MSILLADFFSSPVAVLHADYHSYSKELSRNPKILLIVSGNFGKYGNVIRKSYIARAYKWDIPDESFL